MKGTVLLLATLMLMPAAIAWGVPCTWYAETYLYTDMQVDGSFEEVADHIDPGETFSVGIWYANVGHHTAAGTELWLMNVPDDWTIVSGPHDLHWDIGYIPVGGSGWRSVLIQKGETHANIYAKIRACNADPSESNAISIPVFATGVALLVGGMVGVHMYRKRRGST